MEQKRPYEVVMDFFIRLDTGYEVYVVFKKHWLGNSFLHHYSFHGPISETGYKSHFIHSSNNDKDFEYSKVIKHTKEIATRFHEELRGFIRKKKLNEKTFMTYLSSYATQEGYLSFKTMPINYLLTIIN